MQKEKRGIYLIKKQLKKIAAIVLSASMVIAMAVPGTAIAALPTQDGHGLMGSWYKAKAEGERTDITRFEFIDSNYLGSQKIGKIDDDFKSFIGELLGSGDDSQFVLAKFTGELQIDKEEAYTFSMIGDDGFRLYIDNQRAIDFWVQQWDKVQTSAPILLTPGRHKIQVEYLQGWGGANLHMSWESPSIAKQIVPESVLFQTEDSYYQDAQNALATEIEKCQSVYANYEGGTVDTTALRAALDAAIAVKEADYTGVAVETIINTLNQAKAKLVTAKTECYVSTGIQSADPFTEFYNPLYQGQDPSITQKDGFYYLSSSSNDDSDCKLYVSKSRTLTDQGEKVQVMDMTGKQRRIFAPELFFLNDDEGGHWYIYYCADVLDYQRDYPVTAAKYTLNSSEHHVVCCVRSVTQDPMGSYEDIGPLYCGENNIIQGGNDVTAFGFDGSLFLIWGTLGPAQPQGPAIVEMDTPSSITKDRSMLPIGGGEGPRALKNAKGQLFIMMSEGGYSTNGYRLSTLCFKGTSKDKLLDPSLWYAQRDSFVSTSAVSGPARASFVKSADGTEDWMVYHSRVYKEVGDNWWRQINIKKISWNTDGTPNFGSPASPNKPLALPSGDPGQGAMYQAENSILEGGAAAQNDNANYQGNGYAFIPNKNGAAANFVVNAEEAGDYIVGLRYAYGVQKAGETTDRPTVQLPGRANMNVYVNGILVDKIQMDKTSITWNECFTGSKRLALNKGENLISYTVETGCIGNVNLDYITMYKADVPYTNVEISPQSVTLENTYAVLEVGSTTQLQATVKPENAAAREVYYTSGDGKVARVDAGGKVTALSEGKTVITAASVANSGIKAEFTVVVTKKTAPVVIPETIIKPAYIEFAATTATLTPGQSKALNTKVYPAYAKDITVTYSTSDSKVATVDSKGRITAKAVGTAVITAVANGDKSVKRVCSVTVNPEQVSAVKASRDKKKGSIKVSWKKSSGVDGYIVYRSTSQKGSYKSVKTITKATTASYTDKKVKKGTTYYYQICAYKKVGSKKLTGVSSVPRKVK